MKICYIANANSVHAQRWARHFAQKGHEVHIISTKPPFLEGISVHRIGFTGFKLLSDLVSLFQCRRWLGEIKPDLVHAHYLIGYGLLGALMNYYPFIVSAWGSDILISARKSKLSEYAVRYTLRKADATTCTSHYLYEAILQYAPSNRRLETIPFGIDLNMFKPVERHRGDPGTTIGILKHLRPVYGIDYLIRSIPYILEKHKDIKVLIAGGGDQKPYRRMAKELGIEQALKFIGALPHGEVPEYLSGIDIFVMPSLLESFGVVALEAQAMGVPVVATNIGGIPEVVKDSETGFLVEPRNSKAIADAIIRLLDDEALRKQMGKSGREFVAENYDWSENASRMEALYFELAHRGCA